MTRLRVLSFSLSLDGYGAGPDQDLANPLGIGGEALHRWLFATATFKHVHGETGGSTGVGDRFAAEGFRDVGAWIIGRNMFGPVRGAWPDESWKGWWGDDPPFHVPVFVLTHHARPSLTMRHGLPFCHRRYRCRRDACGRGGRRQGGADRRRGLDHPAVSPRAPDRRSAFCRLARPAGHRRGDVGGYRSGKARLSLHASRGGRKRMARGDRAAGLMGGSGGEREMTVSVFSPLLSFP
jgi:dihydrofolate reductase